MDLEDLRVIINESETHVAVIGSKILCFVCMRVSDDEKTAEVTRISILPGQDSHVKPLLLMAPKMGSTPDCKQLQVDISELDIEEGYGPFVANLKFEGRAPGQLRAYGQTFDNYRYSAPWPLR
jgi:hypothetical protein